MNNMPDQQSPPPTTNIEDDPIPDPDAPDPALLAAMGFASFGAQPGSKRKFTSNSGFVDPGAGAKKAQHAPLQSQAQGKGANAMPLGPRREAGEAGAGGAVGGATLPPMSVAPGTEVSSQEPTFAKLGEASGVSDQELYALRKGLRNAQGDMVYFQPSFIEDPWRNLKGRA